MILFYSILQFPDILQEQYGEYLRKNIYNFFECSGILNKMHACMADTGCQSCLAGVLNCLGITLQDLISVSLKMHAANNKRIRILGAAILRFSGEDRNNTMVETRQKYT